MFSSILIIFVWLYNIINRVLKNYKNIILVFIFFKDCYFLMCNDIKFFENFIVNSDYSKLLKKCIGSY